MSTCHVRLMGKASLMLKASRTGCAGSGREGAVGDA
jgi:hypothetical protein